MTKQVVMFKQIRKENKKIHHHFAKYFNNVKIKLFN